MEDTSLREVAIKVSQYFRDFIESDFKRQSAPRRRIILQTDTGFRAGIRLRTYETLEQEVWTQIGKPSSDTMSLRMLPRKYTRPMSSVLGRIIDEQINVIPETAITAVQVAIASEVVNTQAKTIADPEAWIENLRTKAAEEISKAITRPLIAHLDGPLRKEAYSIVDSLYSAESEMVSQVGSTLDAVLLDVLPKFIAAPDLKMVKDSLAHGIALEGVHSSLKDFFKGFVTSDAYLDVRDLETYASTTEGLCLYLYLGSIKFRGVSYPLFFLPVHADKIADGTGYEISIVNQLYTNRKAIDYVLQELAQTHQREWVSPIQERITYLDPAQSVFEIARQYFRLVVNAVDLAGQIEFSSRSADASNAEVGLSTGLYFAAFEQGEEALVNDYEALIDAARQGGSKMVDLFEGMVKGILNENPVSIAQEVEDHWNALPMVDRLVFDSPIPLNEEQRKILLAVRNPTGKIIVVEGPPGTGKSHTITAIAADCAFNKKTCLVLSDKSEALEVVQHKLSEAMSRVRHERNFPNPLLRLGQQDANFRRLVGNQTVSQITAYTRAMRANEGSLLLEKDGTSQALRDSITGTVACLGKISLSAVQSMHAAEKDLLAIAPEVHRLLHECENWQLAAEMGPIAESISSVQEYLNSILPEMRDGAELLIRAQRDSTMAVFLDRYSVDGWDIFSKLEPADLKVISTLLVQYSQLRMPLFGYLFRGAAVRGLELQLNQLATNRPVILKTDGPVLSTLVEKANRLRTALEEAGIPDAFPAAYAHFSRGSGVSPASAAAVKVLGVFNKVSPALALAFVEIAPKHPHVWSNAMRFLRELLVVGKAFRDAPQLDYVGTKSKLERLNTSVMNSHVDSRLVAFMENHRSDAKAMATVISQRQKFPEEKFENVKESFPVIIASIREFGQYMPLAPDLFDVVVIDEASQVSVAQALPAILRAKKVVVLGDSKQFSNVKSANASIALNEKYRSDLVNYFNKAGKRDAATLSRLAMFDVKKSILEWCSMAASFSIVLRKHFRSYQELISYSSSTFYDHQLQALKIRGVPIEDVIRFDMVDTANETVSRSTNTAEAKFILDRLLELLEEENPPSVGIITPFREQHTLLCKLIYAHGKAGLFEEKLRLKIMTFDSCQGEERQIIFYSLVASQGNDALNYIFPVQMDSASEVVEEKLKAQRLNVGFSRAQEMIWIVHSMPLDRYKGSIARVLHHYEAQLNNKKASAADTDQSSPMEALVLDWLYKTQFYASQPEAIEVLPQFPIGDYLKQLDPTYTHPAWRADFLLTYESDKGRVHIVIEYDGFNFHFDRSPNIHFGNHERYMKESDVERQLTLESYGYRFLRINRFNLGKDPVATLSQRLQALVEMATGSPVAASVERVQKQAADLANKEAKACSRCGEIRLLELFYDKALKGGDGGYGRVCMPCKDASGTQSAVTNAHKDMLRRVSRRWNGYRRF